jgi:hypothetical protein
MERHTHSIDGCSANSQCVDKHFACCVLLLPFAARAQRECGARHGADETPDGQQQGEQLLLAVALRMLSAVWR